MNPYLSLIILNPAPVAQNTETEKLFRLNIDLFIVI